MNSNLINCANLTFIFNSFLFICEVSKEITLVSRFIWTRDLELALQCDRNCAELQVKNCKIRPYWVVLSLRLFLPLLWTFGLRTLQILFKMLQKWLSPRNRTYGLPVTYVGLPDRWLYLSIPLRLLKRHSQTSLLQDVYTQQNLDTFVSELFNTCHCLLYEITLRYSIWIDFREL